MYKKMFDKAVGRVRRFMQEHMSKIVFGTIAFPVFIRLTRYGARKYLEYQANKRHELIRRFKKQQMFEMMEENLGITFRQWYEIMKESITEELNSVKYTELLKNRVGNKLDNWMELKIIAFSNLLAIVHGSSMLIVLLRIQVHVVSGLLFMQMDQNPPGLDDVIEDYGHVARQPRKITDDLQQDYMILTRYLCTEGITRFCKTIREKCRDVIGDLSLKQRVTVTDLQQLFADIRAYDLCDASEHPSMAGRFEHSTDRLDWCPVTQAWQYMFSLEMKSRFLYFPEAYSQRTSVHEGMLRTLVGEAFDLVNGEDAKTILKFLEAQGISHYLDVLSDSMNNVQSSDSEASRNVGDGLNNNAPEGDQPDDLLGVEPSAPIAKLIPTINSFINVPFAEDTWAALLLSNESLKTFSANIYESYSSKQFYQHGV